MRLARLADDLGLNVKAARLAEWKNQLGAEAAEQRVRDMARVIDALRQHNLPHGLPSVSRRLRYATADEIIAAIASGDPRAGIERRLQRLAEEQGFTITGSVVRGWARSLGFDHARDRIRAISAVMTYATERGMPLGHRSAMKYLENADYNLDTALLHVGERLDMNRWLVEQQARPCLHHGRAGADDARAACCCRGCFTGLYLGTEGFARSVIREFAPGLVNRIGLPDLHADEAIPALCTALYHWHHDDSIDKGTPFMAYFAGVLKSRLRTTMKHYNALCRSEIPRSLDEVIADDSSVTFGDRVPDRTVDVQRIVIARDRIFAALRAARERREGAIGSYNLGNALVTA